MFDQLDAGHAGQHFARQVVLRRPQSAGGQHESQPAGGDAEGLDVGVEIVGDGRVPADGDAHLRQAPAEPLAVGVEVLAAGQFAADRDDFAFHGASTVWFAGHFLAAALSVYHAEYGDAIG